MAEAARAAASRARRLTDGATVPDTIPGLLATAAERDPAGVWLRTDDGTLTFAGAAGQVALLARAVDARRECGEATSWWSRRGPRRRTCSAGWRWPAWVPSPCPPIRRPHPRSSRGSSVRSAHGTWSPTRSLWPTRAGCGGGRPGGAAGPGHRLAARELAERRRERRARRCRSDVGPDDLAVLIPTSGTTGRSKLVMQTHRAYAMAGEGFPYWMELDRSDRLMTIAAAVPHQRARVLGAGLAGLRSRARAGPPLLGQRVPRLRPATRRDGVQRDRGHAGDPDAPAGAARRRRHRPAAVLHRSLARRASGRRPSSGGSDCVSSAGTRCRSRRTA